ncbi:unnamed protein product [Penicillium camemberti]|uniref:Str. FM013 n=1 Tax=Penicillium camemberti (strain FM 013) TaxID=1429867 RepID=A0A0G4PUT5_PENC3|nr:unnamed protein product [Penicillium camemberti]
MTRSIKYTLQFPMSYLSPHIKETTMPATKARISKEINRQGLSPLRAPLRSDDLAVNGLQFERHRTTHLLWY